MGLKREKVGMCAARLCGEERERQRTGLTIYDFSIQPYVCIYVPRRRHCLQLIYRYIASTEIFIKVKKGIGKDVNVQLKPGTQKWRILYMSTKNLK